MARASANLDPVTLEIVATRLVSIVDEASASLLRTCFSSAVKDVYDYACALYDSTGNMVAQSTHATPGLLGCMGRAMKKILEHRRHEIEQGDVLITNDPWIVAGHTYDILVVSPIFRDGDMIGFAGTTVHHIDIGGRMATIESRDIFEEGLKLPILKLVRRGSLNEDVAAIIRENVRSPDLVLGDLRAQIAANTVMATRTMDFLDHMDWHDFDEAAEEIIRRTADQMRSVIAAIPDGIYRTEHTIEPTHLLDQPIRIKVSVEVRNDEIVIDYTGTSSQVPVAINSVYNMTAVYSAFAIKAALAPNALNNEGALQPIVVKAPEGSILNAQWPASLYGRSAVVHQLPEIIFQALAPAIPERVIAGGGSVPIWSGFFFGRRPDGRHFHHLMAFQGGLGARPTKDGISCLSFPYNVRIVSIEVMESESQRYLYRSKSLLTDSAGAGRYRGGLGQRVTLSIRSPGDLKDDGVLMAMKGGRHSHTIPGIRSGRDAPPASATFNGADMRTILGRQVELHDGDTVSFFIQGGGGYGDPLERSPHAVAWDVRNGYVSPEAAQAVYGVVLDARTGELESELTKQLRQRALSDADTRQPAANEATTTGGGNPPTREGIP